MCFLPCLCLLALFSKISALQQKNDNEDMNLEALHVNCVETRLMELMVCTLSSRESAGGFLGKVPFFVHLPECRSHCRHFSQRQFCPQGLAVMGVSAAVGAEGAGILHLWTPSPLLCVSSASSSS